MTSFFRFSTQESDLMRFKLQMASPQEVGLFMKLHDLRYTDVDEEEKTRLAAQLVDASNSSAGFVS